MNTLTNTISYEGDAPGDVEFLTKVYAEHMANGVKLYVGQEKSHHEDKPYRCGHPTFTPTFGATRREAVELMIAKIVARRLGSRVDVRALLRENFSG